MGKLAWRPEIFGYTIGHPDEDLSFDERDSAPFVPKCRVIDPAFTWSATGGRASPWERTVIYEAHVKGLHEAPPAGAGGAAGHLRGARAGATCSIISRAWA